MEDSTLSPTSILSPISYQTEVQVASQLISSSSEAVLLLDTAGTVRYSNKASERLFRMKSQELNAVSVSVLGVSLASLEGALIEDGVTGQSFIARKKGGSVLHVSVMSTRLQTVDGPMLFTVWTNISKEFAMESKLIVVSMVVDNCSEVLLSVDAKRHDVLYANKTARHMVDPAGRTPNSFPISLILPSSDMATFVHEVVPLALSSGWRGTINMRNSKTETIIMEATAFKIVLPDDSVNIGFVARDISAKSRQEKLAKRLERERIKMEAIVNGSLDPMIILRSSDLSPTFINKAASKIVGIPLERVESLSASDIFTSESIHALNTNIGPLLQKELSCKSAVSLKNSETGEITPTEGFGFLVKFDSSTSEPYYSFVLRDTRERLRLDQRFSLVTADKAKVDGLMAGCPDFIGLLEVSTLQFKCINTCGRDMLGFGAKNSTASLNLLLSDVVTLESMSMLNIDVFGLLKTGAFTRWEGDIEYVQSSNLVMRCKSTIVPLSDLETNSGDSSGKRNLSSFVGIYSRHPRRFEGDEKQQLCRELFSSYSDEAVIICDNLMKDQPIIYTNMAFFNLTGYSLEDCVGRNPRFFQGRHTSTETLKVIRSSIRSGKGICVKILNYKKDGTSFMNRMNIIFPRVSSGSNTNATHIVGLLRDVTEEFYSSTVAHALQVCDAGVGIVDLSQDEGLADLSTAKISVTNPMFRRLLSFSDTNNDMIIPLSAIISKIRGGDGEQSKFVNDLVHCRRDISAVLTPRRVCVSSSVENMTRSSSDEDGMKDHWILISARGVSVSNSDNNQMDLPASPKKRLVSQKEAAKKVVPSTHIAITISSSPHDEQDFRRLESNLSASIKTLEDVKSEMDDKLTDIATLTRDLAAERKGRRDDQAVLESERLLGRRTAATATRERQTLESELALLRNHYRFLSVLSLPCIAVSFASIAKKLGILPSGLSNLF